MIGTNVDLIKTDNVNIITKAQIGIEGNYFITRDITTTLGVEMWTSSGPSLVLGSRWFPTEDAFIRLRGYVGNNDLSVGAGWSRPLGTAFRFEAIGDFYFSIDFAIRAGVVYIFRR